MDPLTLMLAQMAGAGFNAAAAFYDAKTAQYGLRSKAQTLEFQAGASALNARQAELDAQRVLGAGRRKVGLLGFQAAQQAGARSTANAAGNIAAGVGSAAETAASERYAYAIDTREVEMATAGAAGAARTEAQNARNTTLLAWTEAAAYRRAANKINPWLGAARTFFQGAGAAGAQYTRDTTKKS